MVRVSRLTGSGHAALWQSLTCTWSQRLCLSESVVLALIAGVAGCVPPIIAPTTQDLTGFEEFTFYRSYGLGSCFPEDAVIKADLRRMSDGQVMLETWVLDPGAEIVDDCPAETEWAECLEDIGRALPPRTLTPTEIQWMEDLFRSVTVEQVLWFPICIDPCRIDVARWDGREWTDHKSCTGSPYEALSYEEMEEIINFLETLRAGSAQ